MSHSFWDRIFLRPTFLGLVVAAVKSALGGWLSAVSPKATYLADESTQAKTDVQRQPGRAMWFDGAIDHLDVGQPAELEFDSTGSFSLMGWCYIEAGATGERHIICKSSTSFVYRLGYRLSTYLGAPRVTVGDGTNSLQVNFTDQDIRGTGWRHLAMTYNAGTVKVYLDGVLANSGSAALDPVTFNDPAADFAIGCARVNDTAYQVWQGGLFDVRAYDRNLSDTEIRAIYEATKGPGGDVKGTLYPANLVGHWRLDDGEKKNWFATTALDTSGNGLHGRFESPDPVNFIESGEVPCSFQNELGFSPITFDRFDHMTNMWPGPDSWSAAGTDNHSFALTNQDYRGRENLIAARFTDGAKAGYLENHVRSSLAEVSVLQDRAHIAVMELAFSRPLVAGEQVRIYFTGGRSGPSVVISADDNAWAMQDGITQWTTYLSSTVAIEIDTTNGLYVVPDTNITGGDLTIYIDRVAFYDLGPNPDGTFLDGRSFTDYLPAMSNNLLQDYFGNSLACPGPLAKRADLIKSPCLTFDGVGDYFLPFDGDMDFTHATAFSVAAWVNDSHTGEDDIIGTLTGPSLYKGWVLGTLAGRLRFILSENYGTARIMGIAPSTTPALPRNEWVHIVATYDGSGSGDGITFYIDGQPHERNVGDVGVVTDIVSGNKVRVGMRAAGSGQGFGGRLADLRIFKSVLTPAQVKSIMQGQDAGSNKIAHYSLNEGDGQFVYDSVTGLGAEIIGATPAQAWANTQDVYHAAISKGFRAPLAKRGFREFDGVKYFAEAEPSTKMSINSNRAWFSVQATVDDLSAAIYLAGKYDAAAGVDKREWGLKVLTDGRGQLVVSATGSTVGSVTTDLGDISTGDTVFLIGYVNLDTDTLAISINGGAFHEAAFAPDTTFADAATPFCIGAIKYADGSVIGEHTGRIHHFAAGEHDAAVSMDGVRDAIYNGGDVLSYADLTETQRTTWGLKAWYNMDDFGATLVDAHDDNHLTGSGYDDDLPKPQVLALDTPVVRNYMTFPQDESYGFIEDTPHADFHGTGSFAVSGWVRTSAPPSENGYVISRYLNAGQRCWLMYYNSLSALWYWICSQDGTALFALSTTDAEYDIHDGEWHHFVVAFDASDQTIQMIWDGGAHVESVAGPSSLFNDPTLPLAIGVHGTRGTPTGFTGDLRDIAYMSFNDVIYTPAMIAELFYNGGQGLQVDQLSETQQVQLGVKAEWRSYASTGTLLDHFGSHHLPGKAIPSGTSNLAGPWHNQALTAVNFAPEQNAPWVDRCGHAGYATFDGTQSVSLFGVDDQILGDGHTGAAVSVYARVRNIDITSTYKDILAFGVGLQFHFAIHPDGSIRVYDSTGWFTIAEAGTYDEYASGWADLLFVVNGTSAWLFINGKYIADVLLTDPFDWASATELTLLRHPSTGTNNVIGDVSRIAVYPSVITPSEIDTAESAVDVRFDWDRVEDIDGRIVPFIDASMTPGIKAVQTDHDYGELLNYPIVNDWTVLGYENQYRLSKTGQDDPRGASASSGADAIPPGTLLDEEGGPLQAEDGSYLAEEGADGDDAAFAMLDRLGNPIEDRFASMITVRV